MKIRKGFVSNSSTTSFCLYGLDFCSDDDGLVGEVCKKLGGESFEDLSDGLDFIADKIGLETFYGWEGEQQYIGIEWSNIKDDETGAQFKERITNKLKEAFGDHVKCSTHEEAYRDG